MSVLDRCTRPDRHSPSWNRDNAGPGRATDLPRLEIVGCRHGEQVTTGQFNLQMTVLERVQTGHRLPNQPQHGSKFTRISVRNQRDHTLGRPAEPTRLLDTDFHPGSVHADVQAHRPVDTDPHNPGVRHRDRPPIRVLNKLHDPYSSGQKVHR